MSSQSETTLDLASISEPAVDKPSPSTLDGGKLLSERGATSVVESIRPPDSVHLPRFTISQGDGLADLQTTNMTEVDPQSRVRLSALGLSDFINWIFGGDNSGPFGCDGTPVTTEQPPADELHNPYC